VESTIYREYKNKIKKNWQNLNFSGKLIGEGMMEARNLA